MSGWLHGSPHGAHRETVASTESLILCLLPFPSLSLPGIAPPEKALMLMPVLRLVSGTQMLKWALESGPSGIHFGIELPTCLKVTGVPLLVVSGIIVTGVQPWFMFVQPLS